MKNMMTENSRLLLNMDELNQVAGGVLFEYDRFWVEIPDGEEDPHTLSQRETACRSIYLAKSFKEPMSLEWVLNQSFLDDDFKNAFEYYWDKVILK